MAYGFVYPIMFVLLAQITSRYNLSRIKQNSLHELCLEARQRVAGVGVLVGRVGAVRAPVARHRPLHAHRLVLAFELIGTALYWKIEKKLLNIPWIHRAHLIEG